MRRGATRLLLGVLPACAGPPAPSPATAVEGKVAPGGGRVQEADPATPPRWDSSFAVRHLWPQGRALAETGSLCPFVVHREDATAPYLTVRYDGTEVRSPPWALHLVFHGEPGAVGGWGIGCLRRYDVSLYNYALFWVKGSPAQRFFFRLKDATETEGSVEVAVRREGWQRVVIPLRDFAALDLRTLISIAFGFTGAQGDADLYIDDLEFVRTLPP